MADAQSKFNNPTHPMSETPNGQTPTPQICKYCEWYTHACKCDPVLLADLTSALTKLAEKQAEVDQARTTRREFQRLAMEKHKKDADQLAEVTRERDEQRALADWRQTTIENLTKENERLQGLMGVKDAALRELTNAAEDRLTRTPRSVGDSVIQRQRLEAAVASSKVVIADLSASTESPLMEDKAMLDAIIANKWTVCWNDLHGAFIVQRKDQVVGNIAHGPLRDAIRAAMPKEGEK
jgi:DNA repair exonuclease SbcCD ATPase subunit